MDSFCLYCSFTLNNSWWLTSSSSHLSISSSMISQVRVVIVDENDCVPEFFQSIYSKDGVPETVTTATSLLQGRCRLSVNRAPLFIHSFIYSFLYFWQHANREPVVHGINRAETCSNRSVFCVFMWVLLVRRRFSPVSPQQRLSCARGPTCA